MLYAICYIKNIISCEYIEMFCDLNIHEDMRNSGTLMCSICNMVLLEFNKKSVQCCSKQSILYNNSTYTCANCGLVHDCGYVSEFTDYYANLHRIRRKSIYQRKYHIETVMNNICFKNRIDLTHDQRDRICRVFAEISDIIPTVNGQRKRLISTKYIICRLFELLGIQISIEISKSQKTMDFYYRYWNEILTLKSDKIIHIMK